MSDVRTLIEQLGSESGFVRYKAIRALIGLGAESESATRAMIRTLNDPDHAVADAASIALKGIGQPAIAPLVEAAQSGTVKQRELALWVLSSYSEFFDETLPILNAAMSDRNPRVRTQAARSICGLKISQRRADEEVGSDLERIVVAARQVLQDVLADPSCSDLALCIRLTLRELEGLDNPAGSK